MPKTEVVIIGAGLSGLTAARRLHQSKVEFVILEASDGIGGRVRTDYVEGFQLDRGFQIFLDAYPEPRQWIDLADLQLRPFFPGAQVWFGHQFHQMADPFRRPVAAIGSLLNPIGTIFDKFRVALVRTNVCRGTLEDLSTRPEHTTLEHLQAAGFSEAMIERFFRPFLGGVLLDRELSTSSRIFEFLFRMFSIGNSCLPDGGMGEIPKKLAMGLPPERIRLNSSVESINANEVHVAGGDIWEARAVVIATDARAAQRLTGRIPSVGSRSVQCHYYVGPISQKRQPMLFLDGTGKLPYSTGVFIDSVTPQSAPVGMGLLSMSALGTIPIDDFKARQQLHDWFGEDVSKWRKIREYVITHAQPDVSQLQLPGKIPNPRIAQGLYACGDYRWTASINGAMESGRAAAEAVLADLQIGA